MKRILRYVVLIILTLVVGQIALYLVYPDVSKLKWRNPKKTAFMEFREKQWAREGKKKRIVHIWVPLARISPYAVKAVIIAEDDKFWRHEGFDYEAIQKALEKDLKKKTFSAGGSTISQQLAKNLFLSPEKNITRKIKEAILTWRLERNLSKRRIIELYLNYVEWGDGTFGIEAAARRYFGKSAAELTALEGAKLAAVLPNPLKYNPLSESGYVAKRAERIYQIMVKRGIVIPDYEEVLKSPPAPEEPSETTEPPPEEEKVPN
ncbi:MAG TPA: monofunctional biosynthetic peptidoglycan transglycosylase [Syntrophales bacterium]|nr:monofunctional biosynthetic peptidoglycan transglycosylase [Syntrophales bacterium]HOL58789.1 monofunctional biosynthetic peptidoglycan transglycosylase [Syntrophales bacterium]HPO35116.1 monofunctional biosynthetic peptidoglycan transglycosylase [Syntrophales bacterium]